jgi:hypothetical protein
MTQASFFKAFILRLSNLLYREHIKEAKRETFAQKARMIRAVKWLSKFLTPKDTGICLLRLTQPLSRGDSIIYGA